MVSIDHTFAKHPRFWLGLGLILSLTACDRRQNRIEQSARTSLDQLSDANPPRGNVNFNGLKLGERLSSRIVSFKTEVLTPSGEPTTDVRVIDVTLVIKQPDGTILGQETKSGASRNWTVTLPGGDGSYLLDATAVASADGITQIIANVEGFALSLDRTNPRIGLKAYLSGSLAEGKAEFVSSWIVSNERAAQCTNLALRGASPDQVLPVPFTKSTSSSSSSSSSELLFSAPRLPVPSGFTLPIMAYLSCKDDLGHVTEIRQLVTSTAQSPTLNASVAADLKNPSGENPETLVKGRALDLRVSFFDGSSSQLILAETMATTTPSLMVAVTETPMSPGTALGETLWSGPPASEVSVSLPPGLGAGSRVLYAVLFSGDPGEILAAIPLSVFIE